MLRLTFSMDDAPQIYSCNPALLAQFIRDHHMVISEPTNMEGHLTLWMTVVSYAKKM